MYAMRERRLLDWTPPRASKPSIFTPARPWAGSSLKARVKRGWPGQAKEEEIPDLWSGRWQKQQERLVFPGWHSGRAARRILALGDQDKLQKTRDICSEGQGPHKIEVQTAQPCGGCCVLITSPPLGGRSDERSGPWEAGGVSIR